MCKAALRFLNEGVFDTGINYTFIVLIPKVKTPQIAGDYRPIMLCNMVYNLISKTLANRLKQILPSIISAEQSAFLPNWLISDNFILAYKAIKCKPRRKAYREQWIYYNRIEWIYLEAVMSQMGFDESWMSKIMQCVSTVPYLILVNGSPSQTILPGRGLR